MIQEHIESYFNIFKATQVAYNTPGVNRTYLIRGFSQSQGAFYTDSWRVIGITQAALDSFASVDFARIPNRKDALTVERAHMHQRNAWLSEMFEREWSCANEWWAFIYERDVCILATNSENRASDRFGAILEIAHEIPQGMGYFTSTFIGCKYRKGVERKLLEDFYKFKKK